LSYPFTEKRLTQAEHFRCTASIAVKPPRQKDRPSRSLYSPLLSDSGGEHRAFAPAVGQRIFPGNPFIESEVAQSNRKTSISAARDERSHG
jgi:hypothetical protein